jgi:hypothetical protein
MKVAMKEKLFRALADQVAVAAICRKRPFAVPVGDHGKGEATAEKRGEVLDHHSGFAGVSRSGVVDADDEPPGTGHVAAW